MSAVSAVPVAVRLPRTVGGRRALLTVLFLGALLALAFFFGGSAQAATNSAGAGDGVTAALQAGDKDAAVDVPVTKQLRSEPLDEQFEQNRKKSSKAGGEAVGKVTEPVTESGVSTGKLTRPVNDTISRVAEKVQVDKVTDGLLPGNPDERAHKSGRTDHADHRGHGKNCDTSHAHRTGHDSGRQITTLPAPALPDDVPTHHVTTDSDSGDGNGLPGGRAPLQDAPCVLAGSAAQSVGDSKNGSRGGADQLAAYVTDMERFSLLRPGAVRADNGTATRERSTEILEFPG